MAERWQQWMPLHIDRLRGSPEVQAMHPIARSGYIWLLISQWQSDDGTISSDDLDLATESGLGDDLWAAYKARVLRKFDPVPNTNRLRNAVNYEEWLNAKRIYEARRESAIRTTKTRSSNADRTVTEGVIDGDRNGELPKTPRQADTITGTITGTKTSTKANTPRAEKPAREDKPDDPRFDVFRGYLERYWGNHNPGIAVVWGPQESAQLRKLLLASPYLKADQFLTFLQNRGKSEGVSHGARIHTWLPNITKYTQPLDRYEKIPATESHAGARNAKVPVGKTQGNLVVLQEVIERRQRERAAGQDGDLPASEVGRSTSPPVVHGGDSPAGPKGLPSGDGDSGGESEGRRPDRAPITW